MKSTIKKMEFPHNDIQGQKLTKEQRDDECLYVAQVLGEIFDMKILEDWTVEHETNSNMYYLGFNSDKENVPKLAIFYSRYSSYNHYLVISQCMENGTVYNKDISLTSENYHNAFDRNQANCYFYIKHYTNPDGITMLYILESLQGSEATAYTNIVNSKDISLIKMTSNGEPFFLKPLNKGQYQCVSQTLYNGFRSDGNYLFCSSSSEVNKLADIYSNTYLSDVYCYNNSSRIKVDNCKHIIHYGLSYPFHTIFEIDGQKYIHIGCNSSTNYFPLVIKVD